MEMVTLNELIIKIEINSREEKYVVYILHTITIIIINTLITSNK